jgi:hypothetical protein
MRREDVTRDQAAAINEKFGPMLAISTGSKSK